ncbi:hypothetical protein CIC12_13525, partial [Burkholderia sp. SG-MS1]|uniref:Ig-like domain-containing protein n=1 Tax=Paraburkholderia sp. SG-MS1 TaxID=2023741 RepID=UPI0014478F8B
MSENITIVDKKSHAQTNLTASDVKLVSPSVVELPLRRAEIKSIARDGDALVINTVSGEVIVIHGFFNTVGNVDSDLVLQSDDGLWLLDQSSLDAAHPEGVFSSIDTVEPLLLHDDSGLGALAMILGGLGIAGGAIGLAASSGGDSDKPASTKVDSPTMSLTQGQDGLLVATGHAIPGHMVTVTWPDGSKSNVMADASGNYSVSSDVPQTSGTVEAVATDPAGHVSDPTDVNYTDTTAPHAPVVNVTPNPDGGLTVDGTAEPGSTIIVTYPDGSTASTVADASGNYSVTTDDPQTSGTVEVISTDPAGNASDPTDVNYTDTTPPQAPVVNVTPNPGGGLTVDGKAEAGSTVTVTYPDGSTASTVADASGNYSVTTDVPQTSGTVEAVATDPAGNPSKPTDVTYTDTQGPGAPVVNVTPNADGGLTVGGTAEAGSTVT